MTTTLFINGRSFRPDGSTDNHFTVEVPAIDKPLPWQELDLMYTASGYGKRIPTRTMVQWRGKWRRVYVCQYSNAGTAYIGKWVAGKGAELTISGGMI